MKIFSTMALIGACAFGLTGCNETNSNKTTTVKKETKIDSNGNEKTKIETKTEETTVKTPAPSTNSETTTVRTVEVKSDPVIKIGPLEIKN
jgi:hypothetical protein